MSVIIRLQGLPWSASALDIRHFFKGLTIPAGGVHIIGGDRGDAFIAFSSDEDARQAMMKNMAPINGSSVHLYLSSKSEMQSVIEEARSSEAAAAVGGATATPMMAQQGGGGLQQGGMQQGAMPQGGMQQGGMPHMGMQQGNMQHGGMHQPGGMQQQPGGMQQGGYQQGGMQQPGGMQGDMQQGMVQGFQGQQGYAGGPGMNNQRFPSQSSFQMGRDMNQGQLPMGQNFTGQGPNQMQGQMSGQQMPGQQSRDNQFGNQSDSNQGMNQNFQPGNQQNFPQGQQQPSQGGPPGQGGMNNQQGFTGNNQGNNGNYGQQNQYGSGYGYGMDGNYGGNNYNQWQNTGPGQGQDSGASQQFYGGENTPQGRFPNQRSGQQFDQYGQNTPGQDRQFLPQQQQQQQHFPSQTGETMQKPENFSFSQQDGFRQEGMQQGSDSGGHFPNQSGRPGPPGMSRGGILPHPPMPGQEQGAGRLPDTPGQMPQRPRSDSRGTPDSHLRSPASGRSDSQPPVEQWPSMQKGQDQKKSGGSSEEGYTPQGQEGEGFTPRRGDRFPPRGGMQQGDFPGGPRGGMQQGDFPGGPRGGMQQGDFPGSSRGGMQQSDFPGGSRGSIQQGEFPGGPRGGMQQGEFPGGPRGGMQQGDFPGGPRMGMQQGDFPGGPRMGMQQGDFPGGPRGGMQQGEFPGGPRGGMQQGDFQGGPRGGMQQSDLPGGSRMGIQQGDMSDGPRGNLQQGDLTGGSRGGMQQGELPGGFRGRGILPTPSMPAQGQQGGFSKEPFGDVDAMEHGQWPGYDGEGSMNRSESSAREMAQDPDFRSQEPVGGPGRFPGGDSDLRGAGQGRGDLGGPAFEGPEGGRPMDGPRGRFDVGPDRPMDRGPGGRPSFRDPDSRMQGMGPDGRPQGQGPMGRPFDGVQDRSMERGPERGPDKRLSERGADGRPLEREPDGRPFDRGQDMKSFESGPQEDTDGRFFDRSHGRGPDGRLLDRGHERRPFGGEEEGHPFGNFGPRFEGDELYDPARLDGPGGRFDGQRDRSRFQGPPNRSRFSAPGGRLDGPSDVRFPQLESYDHMDMDIDSQDYEGQGDSSSQERGFPGPQGLEDQDRGMERRGGRGAGPRGRGGLNRGRGYGMDRGFPPYGHPRDEGYPRYPMEQFENQPFDDPERRDMRRFPDEFGDQDFDSRRDFGRGRSDVERGPRGRIDRGRGRFDVGPGRDFDSDRRPNREDVDIRSRYRDWDSDEVRGTGKGLLGDAPTGLMHDPSAKQEEDRDSRNLYQRDIDSPRDRDRRSYSDRRDREDRDRGREDRFGRRFERRRSRDRSREKSRERSPDRDRYSRRSDRDRDRRDRDRDRDRDRSSHNRDRDSRSRDSNSRDSASKDMNSKEGISKDSPNVKKENEKDNQKSEQKPDDKKKTESRDSPSVEEKYIHAKGFPVTYNYREIRRFFFGCELPYDGIKIINDLQGQRTGEVYLKFVNEDTGKRAFRKNGETIFGKPVVLAFTTSKVFESQVDSQTPVTSELEKPAGPVPVVKKNQEKNNLIIMIQSLPFSIKREDLINFFSTVTIADNGDAVFIEYDSRNQATGVAYIETASVQDFKTAMGHDGRLYGARPLKVSAGRREDMELCIKKQQEMFQRQAIRMADPPVPGRPPLGPGPMGPGPMGPRPGLMGQVPGRPGPQGPVNLNPMNMPVIPPRNGPAFDPSLAIQRQQQQQQQQQPQQQQPPPPQQLQGDSPPGDQGPSHCVHIQGLPMLATYKEIREFFADLKVVNNRGIQIVHDGQGKPMGEGFVEFASQEDKEKALKRDKTSMGRHILAVKSVAKADMLERLRNARFVGLPPGQGPPGQPNIPPHIPEPKPSPNPNLNNPNQTPMKPIPPGVLNRQWCYLSCENFPPAVSITEIMTFFEKYNPIPESIRLHYASDGSPTGNAVVGFHKMEEANRALQEMNGKRCRQCNVTLMPAV
ncbi:uncharacterized protein LOC143300759 isoform X2 [Babylonia areolata]|uniref:uncharacterized protein LOC143300759 isoform X2 n=1 Tax=Babylonia areolata TaxID=304850 RepID=UPI003FD2C350